MIPVAVLLAARRHPAARPLVIGARGQHGALRPGLPGPGPARTCGCSSARSSPWSRSGVLLSLRRAGWCCAGCAAGEAPAGAGREAPGPGAGPAGSPACWPAWSSWSASPWPPGRGGRPATPRCTTPAGHVAGPAGAPGPGRRRHPELQRALPRLGALVGRAGRPAPGVRRCRPRGVPDRGRSSAAAAERCCAWLGPFAVGLGSTVLVLLRPGHHARPSVGRPPAGRVGAADGPPAGRRRSPRSSGWPAAMPRCRCWRWPSSSARSR